MKKIFAILMLLPLLTGGALAQDHGVMGFYTMQFDQSSWCDETILSGRIYTGAAGYSTPEAPVPVYVAMQSVQDNNPATWEDFQSHLPNMYSVIFDTHGAAWGESFQCYLDASHRDQAFQGYLDRACVSGSGVVS